MKRRLRFNLASTRLAFYLIALVTLQILVSAIVPQQNIAEEQLTGWRRFVGEDNAVIRALWLDRVYFSPVFHASLALLAINLIVGNVRRFRKVWKVEKTLLKVRHLGSIVFHLALLTVIAGVLLNNLTHFDRVFGVTEGQTKADNPGSYFRTFDGPMAREIQSEFRLELVAIDPAHPVKGTTTEVAKVNLIPTDGSIGIVDMVYINHPVRWRDLEFHLGSTVGFSPEVAVLDKADRSVFKKFVRLKVGTQDGRKIYEDFVVVPGEDLRLKIEIRPQSNSLGVLDRYLTVEKAGHILFQGEVAPGDTLSVADFRIAIPQIRRWCYVHVIHNPWLNVVFIGFWLSLIGLAVSTIPRAFGQKELKT